MKLNRKTFRKLYFKLVKQTGSPDSVARGVAVGLFVGFLIPMSMQMAIALPLAFILKARKIPALAATWVTNPYTILFIYPFQCYIGSYITGNPLSWKHLEKIFGDFIKNASWEGLMALGTEILIPFFAGGALLAVIAATIGYFASYGLIMRHKKRVEMKLRKRLAAAAHRERTAEE